MPDSAKPDEFAIRIASVESLFNELDARPVSQRRLTYDVRRHLLDEWDRLRDTSPSELVLHAPKGEREDTDEDAVREAIRADLHLASLPLRRGPAILDAGRHPLAGLSGRPGAPHRLHLAQRAQAG